MFHKDIYSAAGLMAFIQEVGFLPLLDGGVRGFSAQESYQRLTDYFHQLLPQATDRQIKKLIG